MRRRGKKRELLAPSLFPFLAVLLCTMGALVLILMLVVGQAQATAREMATSMQERTEEIQVHIELVRESLEKERNKQQLELEKKRLTLQSFEDQIQQSLDEMRQLSRTAELIDSQSTEIEEDGQLVAEKLSALEKQLAEAASKLKKKLEKPTGEKPVFAIIPYEGPNGTHRRPVYLECRQDGVVIQPEGVLIGLRDLRPPYGPGNPLDAALRTIRNRYAPANGALTSNAYPLLVVRPSGIQTYALARLAMAGWDDQFGYELIADDMELVFPEGEPGLRAQIEQSLAMARNRQAALVLAMPGKYRREIESFDDERYEPLGESGGGFGDATSEDGMFSGGRSPGGGDSLLGFGSGGDGRSATEQSGAGLSQSRGGYAFDSSDVTGSGALPAHGGLSGESGQMNTRRDSLGISNPGFGGQNASDSDLAAGQSTASSGNFDDLLQQARSTAKGNPGSGRSSSTSTSRGTGSSSSETSGSQNSEDGIGSETDQSGGPSKGPAGQAGRTGNGGSQAAQAGMAGTESSPQSAPNSPSAESQEQSQSMPTVSMNLRQQPAAEPVAKRKGRNWAWSERSGQGTALVRSIRIACFRDRWIVLPENSSSLAPVTIPLTGSPQSSAEQLAKTIADRVDRWGLALAGGYWKPTLVVEVAPDAQPQFEQLKRLLDGSGLEVQPAIKPR